MMKLWAVLLAASLAILPPLAPGSGGQDGQPRAGPGAYHTYDSMVSDLQNLSAAYPDIVKLQPLCQTWEGRIIWAVKLSDNVSIDEPEPNITVLGGIHAREFIGVEVCLHLLFSLVENYSTNATVKWYIDGAQLWFVPMVNPDGHAYVEKGADWRKNRRPNGDGTFGVDLNRNFGHLWGLKASTRPADDDYCGPYAFSENETQAVSRLVTDHPPAAAVSYHSFGNYILYPWGNDIDQEPVDPRLQAIAGNMSRAMPEGRRYIAMMAREMYTATGDTDDYFYANLSILPFTVELAGAYRPADSEVPIICDDNHPAALYLLDYAVGAPPPPPPPPPRRSITLAGPGSFHGFPLESVLLNFSLENSGEADEDVSLCVTSPPEGWTFQLTPERAELGPGNATALRLWLAVPADAPAFQSVNLTLNATAASGANASASALGMVDRLQSITLNFGSPGNTRPGENVTLPIFIGNNGNHREAVSVTAAADTGWRIVQIPSPFELEPGSSADTFIRVQVAPAPPLDLGWVNITFNISTADGGYQRLQLYQLPVQIERRLDIMPASRRLELHSGDRYELSVELTNSGNVRERLTVNLTGNTAFATADRKALELPPHSNATLVLALAGQKGNWTVDVNFISADGYPVRQTTVNFLIGSRPSKPAPDRVRVVATLAVLLVVLAVVWISVAVLILRVRGKKRSRGKEDA